MKGIIFIPDISGFTNFVRNIDIDLGVCITRDLLSKIIENNSLRMELSEIEGDSILFYKLGKPIPLKYVLSSFKMMYDAFDAGYLQWKLKYNLQANLSLKLIVHYGNIAVYDIKGFKKLYGETVIESHNLLKNGNGKTDYILVTEDYLKALHQELSNEQLYNRGYTSFRSHLTTDVKKIPYYFFSSKQKPRLLLC
ncbi:MAG: DUF2652 domain-containing protein [Ferruginibacter sp.]